VASETSAAQIAAEDNFRARDDAPGMCRAPIEPLHVIRPSDLLDTLTTIGDAISSERRIYRRLSACLQLKNLFP